jgi:hypothetical protein
MSVLPTSSPCRPRAQTPALAGLMPRRTTRVPPPPAATRRPSIRVPAGRRHAAAPHSDAETRDTRDELKGARNHRRKSPTKGWQVQGDGRPAGALLTAEQMARLLGVPRTWVYEQSRCGRVPPSRWAATGATDARRSRPGWKNLKRPRGARGHMSAERARHNSAERLGDNRQAK